MSLALHNSEVPAGKGKDVQGESVRVRVMRTAAWNKGRTRAFHACQRAEGSHNASFSLSGFFYRFLGKKNNSLNLIEW